MKPRGAWVVGSTRQRFLRAKGPQPRFPSRDVNSGPRSYESELTKRSPGDRHGVVAAFRDEWSSGRIFDQRAARWRCGAGSFWGLIHPVSFRSPKDPMSLYLIAAVSAVLPAQGNAPFGEPLPLFASFDEVSDEVILDLDGDGRLDVVFGSRISSDLVAIRNIDGERFAAAAVHVSLSQGTSALAAGDLDGNGSEDVVQLDQVGRVVWIPTGTDGHALDPTTVGFLNPGPVGANWRVFVAELDGDGTLDIGAVSLGESVFWRGLGGGAFASSAPLVVTGLGAQAVFPLDVDGDEDLDLVALGALIGGGSTATGLLYLENTAGFPLDPADAVAIGQNDSFPFINPDDLSGADFDLDGDLDLLVNQGELRYVENLGAAGFAENVGLPIDAPSPFATVGDFDADGRPDVALRRTAIEGVAFLRGAGDGSFSLAETYSYQQGGLRGLQTADLTGDGIDDWLLTSSFDVPIVNLYPGGQGAPAPGPPLRLNPSDAWRGLGLVPSQAHGAGFDLITYEKDERIINRRPANGLGFGAPERLLALGTGGSLSAPAFGDVNGDGVSDLVFGLDGRLEFLPALTGGLFGPRQPLLANGNPIAAEGLELRFADLDGVHGDDLVYRDGTRTYGALRTSTGGYSSPVALGAGHLSEPAKALLADLDGDGLVDLVYDLQENIEWARNLGGGLFQSRQVLATLPRTALRPIALDVDEDGDLDLVTGSAIFTSSSYKTVWLRNDGAGSFADPAPVAGTSVVLDLEVMDVDLDGRDDLLARGGGRLNWIQRTGPATFAPPVIVMTGLSDSPLITGSPPANYEIRCADLDGDGDTDVVLGGGRDGAIVVMPNNVFGPIGLPYCTAADTSLGAPATLAAYGSTEGDRNAVELRASDLPLNTFGFFLNSLDQGFVPGVGGTQGNLCLGGSIGRYVGTGEIGLSGAAGSIFLTLDPAQTPTPAVGFVSVQAGQTWNFQCWFRDVAAGQLTANLTPGVEIQFR